MASVEPFLAGELHLISLSNSFYYGSSKVGVILFSLLSILNLSHCCRSFKSCEKQ